MNQNIAIDGPAGAGKSTIARKIAEEIGAVYVDTGAMYRAVSLCLVKLGIAPEDSEKTWQALRNIALSIKYDGNEQHVLVNGEDYNPKIRTEEAGKAAAAYAKLPEVREYMLKLQQDLASNTRVVMDGRDIGTKVLPDAGVKIFLTASVPARAARRYKELTARGEKVELAVIEADIEERDRQDSTRAVSPLRRAEDAVLLDSSNMSIAEVVQSILSICQEKQRVGE